MQNSVQKRTEKFSHVWPKKNVFIHPTKKNCVVKFFDKNKLFFVSLSFLIESFFFPFFSKARDGLLSKLNCLIEEGMEKAKFLLSPILGLFFRSSTSWAVWTFLPLQSGDIRTQHDSPPLLPAKSP